jgi:hypothetical protein
MSATTNKTNKESEMRTYYQECGGQLLNVYRCTDEDDEINLAVGEIINDPAEHHCEGDAHTTIRRVE